MHDADVEYHPVFKALTYVRHFPILYRIHAIIPIWVYSSWLPLAKYQRDAEDHIRSLVSEHDRSSIKAENDGLLYHFVEQDPRYRTNNLTAAVEEFTALQWGGRECMLRVHQELKEYGFINLSTPYATLQDIPYLRAVCKEGLRMQLPGGFRIPRTNKEPFKYGNYVIPAKTPVSMCPNFFHDDENIFPQSHKFIPERWLQPNAEELDKHWKPFGNGTRSCIGMKLVHTQ